MNAPDSASGYAGKTAYRGDIVTNYDRDRQVEQIWAREQDFVAEWAKALKPGERVLDLPAGTGRFVRLLLDRGVHVVAADISPDMLRAIRSQFDPAGHPHLDLCEADAEHMPFADAEFNYVLSWRLFHLLPEPVIAPVLREMRRVARDSIVLQVFAVRPASLRPTLWSALKDRLRPLVRRFRRRTTTSPWAHITSYSHDEEKLLAAFAAVGLRLTDARTLDVDAGGLLNRVYFLAPQ